MVNWSQLKGSISLAGKSSDVQIQIDPNLQIQIQIRSFSNPIQIQPKSKSSGFGKSPNPDLDLPTIDPFVEKKKTRLLGSSKGKSGQVDQDIGGWPLATINVYEHLSMFIKVWFRWYKRLDVG